MDIYACVVSERGSVPSIPSMQVLYCRFEIRSPTQTCEITVKASLCTYSSPEALLCFAAILINLKVMLRTCSVNDNLHVLLFRSILFV